MEPSRRTVLRAVLAGAAGLLAACNPGRPRTVTAGPTSLTAPGSAPAASAAASSRAAATGSGGRPAREVVRGSADRREVALTFHASGDPALVEPLLSAAERAGAGLTVFVVGSWLAQHPQFAARIVRGGHELANHTWTHPDLAGLPAPRLDEEVVRCRDLLQRLAGTPGAWFRPSQADHATPAVLAAAGRAGYRTSLAFDVDPKDFRDPGADAVRRRVLAGVRPGSIVSLHFGHRGTVDALPGILTGLSDRGLRAVTAGRLLGRTP